MRAGHHPAVLSLLGAFWPGNDASGPNQSYKAMAEALQDEFDFHLIARNRPFGSSATPNETQDCGWKDLSYCKARYLPPGRLAPAGLGRILTGGAYDVLWLNGFFDREFTIPALMMRLAGRLPRRPAILSPRGEFNSGALGLKSRQKQAYLSLCRNTPLLNGVILHATSSKEADNIREMLPRASRIEIAPNVRLLIEPNPGEVRPPGAPLRIAFVGRIARVKNLDYALRVLAQVKAPVQFNIYGPIQEHGYWLECQTLMSQLPSHVQAVYHGELPNDAIAKALSAIDLFFLPTTGENFGHAIFEALSCGVPVLIADTTPWSALEQDRAGIDLPLQNPALFASAIMKFQAMNEAEYVQWRHGARTRAQRWAAQSDAVAATRALLQHALRPLSHAR